MQERPASGRRVEWMYMQNQASKLPIALAGWQGGGIKKGCGEAHTLFISELLSF